MSTGAQHYIESERRLARADDFTEDSPEQREALAFAQVHATLALAAATALGSARVDDHGMLPVDINDWFTAASADDLGHGTDPDDTPVIITEEVVAESLTAFGDGVLEHLAPLTRQGPGVFTRVRLPIGMVAASFLHPEKLARLATSLGRGVHEVHPSPDSDHDARVLRLWIADKAATQ